MTYHRLKFSILALTILTVGGTAFGVSAQEVTLTAKYQGGEKDGQNVVGGIEPNSNVELEAFFDGNPESCAGTLNYELFYTMAHAIGGNLNNLEYLSRGEGDSFAYTFNSNRYGQENIYQAVFYCWSSDNPSIALGTAQQWRSPTFNQTTLGGSCEFSNPEWVTTDVGVGEAATMSVSGTTNGCQGVGFQFEVWGGAGGCQGLGNRVAATVEASFPTNESLPLSVTREWEVPDDKEYCFKIRLPGGVNNCARASNGNCLWSRALRAEESEEGEGEGTSSAFLEFPNPLRANDLRELIDAVMTWLRWLAIPIAVIMILYAGLRMMLAGDDPKGFQSGRKILLWAVVGLAVIFIGEGFIALIESILDLGK